MNNKKLFLIPMFLILGSGIIFAAWAFSYNNTIQATVLPGGGVLLVIEDMSDFDINASVNNVNNTQSISLFNRNGLKSTTLNFTVDKVLTEPSCLDYQNDCVVEFWNSTNELVNNGDEIKFVSGFNNYFVITSCVQNSCGQNISIEVDIQ